MISQRKAIFVNESFQVRILILFFNKDTHKTAQNKKSTMRRDSFSSSVINGKDSLLINT